MGEIRAILPKVVVDYQLVGNDVDVETDLRLVLLRISDTLSELSDYLECRDARLINISHCI